jgi:hypothetical protein
MEWAGHWFDLPRYPVHFTIVTALVATWVVWRFWTIRRRVQALKLGRDGERAVGEFLERLRSDGAHVFHDIPAEGFNLDHVVISPHGIYVIETKTLSKPIGDARVVVDGDAVVVAGRSPDRAPLVQAAAEAHWLRQTLEASTGRRLPVRGVVVYPGWFVEQRSPRGDVWVLEPKALPAFIGGAPRVLADEDVRLAAYHLSRYVRTTDEPRPGFSGR